MLPVSFAGLLREGDLSQNIYLRGGNFVYLPSALSKEVYVLGAVRQPRAVGFAIDMCLASVIGAAQGSIPGADLSRVVIVRSSLSDPAVATVDFRAVQQGKAPNVRLEPRDIVYVPGRVTGPVRTLVEEAVNTFAKTVAANEGRAADSPGTGPVEPSLSIGQPAP
jgi:protein involved in polysaccharide export with SLBB domain